MHVDCDRCAARGPAACGDCVVTVLLGAPPDGIVLDAEEQHALESLAAAGLVPPLRLVATAATGPVAPVPVPRFRDGTTAGRPGRRAAGPAAG